MEIKIGRSKKSDFILNLRVPGWAQNKPVPSDLYQFTDRNAESVILKINGKTEKFSIEKGYITLNKKWKEGDVISLNIPMPVRKVATADAVKNDTGKLAYQRGPLVYCFEDKDNNNGFMFDNFASANAEVTSEFDSGLLGGVVKLKLTGSKISLQEDKKVIEPVDLTAIPYYAWNNRGRANMLIWLPDGENTAVAKPAPALTDSAEITASTDYFTGLNDGFDPKNSGDTDKSYFYWWQKEGSDEWVEYNFKEPVNLSKSSVYWLNMDHYDGNYRVPESWSLQVKDGKGNWKNVETADAYSTAIDQYNTVKFAPVITKAIRLNARLQKDASGGIHEWKVN